MIRRFAYHTFLGQTLLAVADIFSFGGAQRSYPSVSAEEMTRKAWSDTGASIQSALTAFKQHHQH